MVVSVAERKYKELLLVTCKQTELSHSVRIAEFCPNCGLLFDKMSDIDSRGRSKERTGAKSRSSSNSSSSSRDSSASNESYMH